MDSALRWTFVRSIGKAIDNAELLQLSPIPPPALWEEAKRKWENPRPKLWYISFADGSLPKGTQFLGACVVEAVDLLDAIQEAHRRGCNPGGEAQVMECPPEAPPVPEEFKNRLLNREAIDAMDKAMGAAA